MQAAIGADQAFAAGHVLLERRDILPAIECFDSAQHGGYDASQCAAARWDCWMFLGDFERAWRESDAIRALGKDHGAFWSGESWEGKRVMLRCLHGLGDAIQFIRYAPLLKRTCQSLAVQTHPQLVTLLEGVAGVDRVITWPRSAGEEDKDWDFQMEVTELPRAFRTTVCSSPSAAPYIHVPRDRVEWASGLFEDNQRMRVGFVWEAGPWNPARSTALDEWSVLFASKCRDFYVLQKDVDPVAIRRWSNVHELESHSSDVRDTAALISNLDLVISVDTMTAHLAGALNRPAWILLPKAADWRWMLDRADTPWYPTARLFRQQRQGDWSGVFSQVADALQQFRVDRCTLPGRALV